MFKLKYEKFFQNEVYTKYNIEFPREDYHYIEKNIFCVTDGVTRDLKNGKPSFYPKNKEEAKYLQENYPNPTGAFQVAKTVAENFVKYVKNIEQVNEDKIKEAVRRVNADIWDINKERNINYLEEDLYCTEAVGGVIQDKYLYCFGIGDCYIKVFDKENNEIFSTENDHLWSSDFEKEFLVSKDFSWEDPRCRILIRAGLRNNPIIKYKGKHAGFGALTGENNAMNFVKVYKVPLDKAKYICAYTDGCIPYFKDNAKKTLQNPEIIEKDGVERTIIIYEDE